MPRFELGTSPTRTERATRLRHTPRPGHRVASMLRAVLFDVDFTLARPGPELGPEGYVRAGERHGLRLEPGRYEAARDAALVDLRRHPELEHDDEIWFRFTERIVRGMGGDADSAYACAVEITRALGAARELRALRRRAGRADRTSLRRPPDRPRLELRARRARVRAAPRARRRRGHQLLPPRPHEAARIDLPRRPRPARGRAGRGGDGRRHDRRRHRGRAARSGCARSCSTARVFTGSSSRASRR